MKVHIILEHRFEYTEDNVCEWRSFSHTQIVGVYSQRD